MGGRAKRSPPAPALEAGGDAIEAGAAEHYRDAVLYDFEYRGRRRDARFYADLAARHVPEGEAVLELACGSGRVTQALVRRGLRVVGVDHSRPMLARARARLDGMSRAHRARAHLVCADMRQLRLGARFPLVIMAFNSFEHLYERADVEACLARVEGALAPGGVFAFDVQLPEMAWLIRSPRRRWARTTFRHPETGERLVYTTNHIYDPVSQICLVRIYYRPEVFGPGARERVVRLSQRKFFPAELEATLDANGFAVAERYGDFAGAPLAAGAESQVLVCRRR